jgi:hypothetical protein
MRAQKMMRGRVESFTMPIMVKAMPIILVQASRQTIEIPQMTTPQET